MRKKIHQVQASLQAAAIALLVCSGVLLGQTVIPPSSATSVLTGSGAPSNPCSLIGAPPFYINSANGDLYTCPTNGGSWVKWPTAGATSSQGSVGAIQVAAAAGTFAGTTHWSNVSPALIADASGVLDLHLAGTGGLLFPGAWNSGFVRTVTATGAGSGGELSGDCTTSGNFAVTCTPLLHTANNLSELTATASTARTNIGLGTVSTHAATEFALAFTGTCGATHLVLGNSACLATANSGVVVTSGAGAPLVSTTLPSGLNIPGFQASLGFTPLNPANNLADVSSVSGARSALGLGSFTGIRKANGTGVDSAAVSGTDYQIPFTATPPITFTANIVACNVASGSQPGCLSSADWTTFNGKQATIGLTTSGTSGAATLVGVTLNIPQYQGAISLTTTGTSGAATLVGTTLNIPQYTGGSGCSGSCYATIESNGSALAQQTTLNFSSEFTAVDNPGASRTDVSVGLISNTKITGLGTASTHPATDFMSAIAPGAAGHYVRSNGAAYADSAIQAADVPTLNQNTTGNATTATSATSATTATNLAGGAVGSIPYQSAGGTTLFRSGNTAATDQVLVSHGTGAAALAPTLTNAPALSAASMTSFPTLNQSTTGNAATATALAANGTNCSAGSPPLGVDASGNVESCTALLASQVTNAFDLSANNSLGAHSLNFTDISTPAAPATSHTLVYTKGGKVCAEDPSAGETCTGTFPLTTKGDILSFTTVPVRIPVGTDTFIPVADSTLAAGWGWKANGALVTFQNSGGAVGNATTLNLVNGTGMSGSFALVGSVMTYTPSFNTAVIATHDQIHANENYVLSSTGTTSYTGTMANKALTVYTKGMVVWLETDADCTTSCTFNLDSNGNVALKKADGATDPGGTFKAHQPQPLTLGPSTCTVGSTCVWLLPPGGSGGGGVTAFSGDGAFATNSSSTGAVTLTLATAGAHTFWMNNTGSTAAAGYQAMGLNDLPSGVARTATNLSQFAATTSAQIRGVISDESGGGALFFAGGNIGAATGTSLALGGATLGSNALAITGSMAISGLISGGIIHQYGASFGTPGGAALTTGGIQYFNMPQACTIGGWEITADAGTATVKFWKIAAGTAIPTVTNVINTSGVALASGTHIKSTTVTDFTTTTVTADDIGAVTLTAVSGAGYVQAVMLCQ